MKFPSAIAALLFPVLGLSAAAAHAAPRPQDAPRLDGSNVPQPVVSLAPPPASTTAAPAPSAKPIQPTTTRPLAVTRHGKSKPSAAGPPVILIPPAPPTPADLPPVPATVFFSGGMLTVHARNATLSQILHDTSTQTGMQLEGTPEEQRIFGDFGPAPVPVVLGQLLDGGPSNYVLFGRNANLAPRTLVITPKSSLAPGQVAGVTKPPVTINNEDDDDDDAPPVTNPQPGIHPIMPNRGLGAGGGDPNARTPQQIIDDLQRRRQEQQLSQPPPENNQ